MAWPEEVCFISSPYCTSTVLVRYRVEGSSLGHIDHSYVGM